MTRLERNANIAAVVIPFLGVIGAAVLLWHRFLGPRDLAIFAVMYLLSAIGVTVGYHRLLTHSAFETRAWLRYALAVMGSLSLQGGVIDWVADHRKHHTFTDEEGDPHSPHAGAGAGLSGMVTGLWHAHVGWLFETHGQASSKRFAPDLVEGPDDAPDQPRLPAAGAGEPARPFLAGFALSGGSLLAGGLSALLWGGLVRIFLVHHITWSINSICHFFGAAPIRHRRSVDQRLLAGPAVAGRGLAPQPPRLPPVGLPRPALVRAGPLRLADPRDGAGRTGLGRREGDARAAAREARRRAASPSALADGSNTVRELLPCRPRDRRPDRGPVKPRLRGVSHEYAFFVSLACGGGADPRRGATAARALAAAIYAGAVSGLLGTSALYHRVTWRPRARRWMRRLDHSMIFVLIAGTYTPGRAARPEGHARDDDPDRAVGRRPGRRRVQARVDRRPEVALRCGLRRARAW